MHCYCHLIANYPLSVAIAVVVIAGTGIVISFTANDVPDFSDPQLGFESRGTELAGRLKSWQNFIEETRASGSLTTNPSEAEKEPVFKKKWKKSKKKFRDKGNNETAFAEPVRPVRSIHSHTAWGYMVTAPSNYSNSNVETSKQVWRELSHYRDYGSLFEGENSETFFCDAPRIDYAHFIIKPKYPNGNLVGLASLREICFLDAALRHHPDFEDLCTTPHESTDCCRSWHLPNYIALLVGKESCEDLTESDIVQGKDILCTCLAKTNDDTCSPNNDTKTCQDNLCPSPVIADQLKSFFLGVEDLENLKGDCSSIAVQFSGIYLPLAKSTALTDFYQDLVLPPLQTVDVVGYDLGIKTSIFNLYLKRDLMLLIVGAVLVGICMWLYFQSLIATVAVFLSVFMSVGMAYFVYFFVFEIRFFPFVNLLVLIIALGVGVDDAFIYFHHWKLAKLQLDGSPLSVVVAKALGASAPAMLVTSLTTSAACYASYASDVTALKAFGIFTGTTILFNYFLVITWLPAVIVLVEKCPNVFPKITFPKFQKISRILGKVTCVDPFSKGIEILKHLLITVFIVVTVVTSVVVFYYPKFSLPSEKDFRLFQSNHPFETYSSAREHFLAGKGKEESVVLPLRFVFGVMPIDNGNYLEPSSTGKLVLDEHFNVSTEEAQVWLLNFCKSLKRQPFADVSFGLQFKNCFIEKLISFMERPCLDPITDLNRSPCCASSTFPFEPSVFDLCLLESAKVPDMPVFYTGSVNAGPRFFRHSKKLAAFAIEYDSNYTYSLSLTEMSEFYTVVESWFLSEMIKAPEGLKSGFFVSYFEFYDLQVSLSHGTMISVLIAMSVSLVLLLIGTRNILVSISSAVVTYSIVISTFSILIALGWELNVLESASICLAVGLSVDYALHFAVAWCGNQDLSLNYILSSVGQPVAVAALTTVLPGLAMLVSPVLVYKKIGIFILIVTSISWCYSVFFLLPLLFVLSHKFDSSCFDYFRKLYTRSERSDPSRYLSVPAESHIISLSSSSTCVHSFPVLPKPNSLELETFGNV